MGTRASFWLGDPRDLKNRKWLGCIAWDGYPKVEDDSAGVDFRAVETKEEFLQEVQKLVKRDDFAHPGRGWPFPWDDDIFLTHYTYAYFSGKLHIAHGYREFVPFKEYHLSIYDWDEREDKDSFKGVPAPEKYNPEQPDSIMWLIAKDPED